MRIALLEDEPSLAAQLSQTLSLEGHSCFVFHSGEKLIRFLRQETMDVLLLDWNVPDMPGLEVVRWVKSNLDRPPPILMLTARSMEQDIVTALQAGADDYVTKPAQTGALMARIEALRRRAYPDPPSSGIERFGRYVFCTRMQTLEVDGEAVPLTAKEFALALLLFRNMNRTLSRAYVFETLWGKHPDLQTRTLDSHVSKVRSKLNLRAGNGFKLVPVYAYGYRLESMT